MRKVIKKTSSKNITKEQNVFVKFFSKIKWVIVELIKVYSSHPSYFSKKRIESGIGFIIAEWGMIFFLLKKIDALDAYEFAVWASIQFLVAGYMVKQIQNQKEFQSEETIEEPEIEEIKDVECECECHDVDVENEKDCNK